MHYRNAHVLQLSTGCLVWLVVCSLATAQVPFEGFIPFAGISLTNEFEDSTAPGASPTFFIAEASDSIGGQQLGPGNSAYYDIALFDTGAATHILTNAAHVGFNIHQEGFDGTNTQLIGGATGQVVTEISDPLGFYMAGLADRTSPDGSAQIQMNPLSMRGQTSFALLSAPQFGWSLPNIIGLPIAAQHSVSIRNDQPQIFEHAGRTVRTPHIELNDLGSGGQGITRRLPLKVKPGIAFVQGPFYIQNFDFTTFNLHENPLSPSIIENGGLFVDVDMIRGGDAIDDKEFLFDTGASLTVVSEQTAVRLGFDPLLDTPDFVVQVEGSGGVEGGIPGFYADQLELETVGGSFVAENVPVAVLDVTNPNDPGNIIDGIIGTNLFVGRNLVIDANPQIGQGGAGPSVYIGDSVMQRHVWGTQDVTGDWHTPTSWTANGVPAELWDAVVSNVRGSDQQAVVNSNSTVYRAAISGIPTAEMSVRVTNGSTLTTFADLDIRTGGRLHLAGGKVDAQFISINGGTLSGSGEIFVGVGPISGAVRNQNGVVAPGDAAGDPIGTFDITGDFINDAQATLAIDIGGTVAGVGFDLLTVDRAAFISGTLEATLVGGFAPQIGQSFTFLTTGNAVEGEFSTLALPSGFQWDVIYTTTTVRLEVAGIGLTGDLNGDGNLDCQDIDALTAAVASGSTSATYDFTGDGMVNGGDINEWITNIKGTLLGDANLDGSVDGADFLIWNNSKFLATDAWCEGDFDGSGSVDGADFLTWNNNKFASVPLPPVPEPSTFGLALLTLGLPSVLARRAARSSKPAEIEPTLSEV